MTAMTIADMGPFAPPLTDVLRSLGSHSPSVNGEIFRLLYLLSFDDLVKAKEGNPLDHHLVVLQHAIHIAQEQGLSVVNAGAIAILHDIGPVDKIRRADVEAAKEPGEKAILEQRRRQNRILHMREGSAMAQRKLLACNEYLGRAFFSDDDIDEICEVIRTHDDPSIDVPIPRGNRMAVSFREADRLWMLSERGFACDMARDAEQMEKGTDEATLAASRLEHIVKRYREECRLYAESEGPFQDSSLFFRTKAGYELYLRYMKDRRQQYGLA